MAFEMKESTKKMSVELLRTCRPYEGPVHREKVLIHATEIWETICIILVDWNGLSIVSNENIRENLYLLELRVYCLELVRSK